MQVNTQFEGKPKGQVRSYKDQCLTQQEGKWIPSIFMNEKILEFNDNGLIQKSKEINASTGAVETEISYQYTDRVLTLMVTRSLWGESTEKFSYRSDNKLQKSEVINSSNDNFSTHYEYDSTGYLARQRTEFRDRSDFYDYTYSREKELLIIETLINGVLDNVEYKNDKKEVVKRINRDGKMFGYEFNSKGMLLKETSDDFVREFEYGSDEFPVKYNSYLQKNRSADFNKEFYSTVLDKNGNWTEIKCFCENNYTPKHLELIRKRTIVYF